MAWQALVAIALLLGGAVVMTLALRRMLVERPGATRPLVPICSSCKKIRRPSGDPDTQDDWQTVEPCQSEGTEARLTHGCCPRCLDQLTGEFPMLVDLDAADSG